MTLHPIPLNFLIYEEIFFFFISVLFIFRDLLDGDEAVSCCLSHCQILRLSRLLRSLSSSHCSSSGQVRTVLFYQCTDAT
jgi:hypothetical protein